MKRLYPIIISLLFAIPCMVYDFSAPDVNGNMIYYNILGGDSVEVTYKVRGSNFYSGDVVIPEIVNNESSMYRVVEIGDSAFYLCSGLTTVEFPNSVTSIDSVAFYACSGLTSVTIQNNVISIGAAAFCGCSGLTSVHITNLGQWCRIKFDGSASNPLNEAHHLYLNGSEITNLVVPEGVDSIRSNAFAGCSGLISVTIPESVMSIGRGAFINCSGLAFVHITDLAKWCEIQFADYDSNPLRYAKHLYLNGSEVTDLVIPEGVESVGNYAFYNCSSLTSVTIPESVTSIGRSAFYECSGLSSVDIPHSVTSIGAYAFRNCSKLDNVYCSAVIPPSVDTYTFYKISPTATLFVPYEAIEAYMAISAYADAFAEIKGFSDAINITETTVDIIWLPDPEVTEYTITIYQNAAQIAHYIVDGDGQVISSQRYAPSVYKQKMDTTQSSTEYFVVYVDELEAGTDYTYTIEGTNSQQQQIYHEEGTFQTNNHEGIFDSTINECESTRKVIRNGKVYILRSDALYDLHGRQVDLR